MHYMQPPPPFLLPSPSLPSLDLYSTRFLARVRVLSLLRFRFTLSLSHTSACALFPALSPTLFLSLSLSLFLTFPLSLTNTLSRVLSPHSPTPLFLSRPPTLPHSAAIDNITTRGIH